jgi:tRNA pseudouridine38-40 synthase
VPTWKITIEYEGTRYHGWQDQKNARTVGGIILQSAEAALGKPVEFGGAGRTDAGVHALAQVAHLRARRLLPPVELLRRLNSELPADINVLKVEPAPAQFHARRDALVRSYLYQIATRRTAFAKPFVWWVKSDPDPMLMSEAAKRLTGKHDFGAFCDKRAEDKSTVVSVDSAELALSGDLILFRICASHFLWRMVRRIVGMLVEVGAGSVSLADFDSLINPASRRRTMTGLPNRPSDKPDPAYVAAHTAPSSGLFLERIIYSKGEILGPVEPAFPVLQAYDKPTS